MAATSVSTWWERTAVNAELASCLTLLPHGVKVQYKLITINCHEHFCVHKCENTEGSMTADTVEKLCAWSFEVSTDVNECEANCCRHEQKSVAPPVLRV